MDKKIISPKKDYPIAELLLALLITYLVGFAFRMYEFQFWNESMKINGHYILSTNDAYAWLAGAADLNRYALNPFSEIIAKFKIITGLPLETLGFWLPAYLAPLVAVPIVFVALRARELEASIFAGIIGSSCFAFLSRTRLGCYDTDLVTLLCATSIIAAIIILCWPFLSRVEEEKMPDNFRLGIYSIFAGSVVWIFYILYERPEVALLFLGWSFIISLIFAKKGTRQKLFYVFVLASLVGFGHWAGLFCALILMFLVHKRKKSLISAGKDNIDIEDSSLIKHIIVGAIVAIILSFIFSGDMVTSLVARLIGYMKPVAEITKSQFTLPSIAQSVSEAQNIGFNEVMAYLIGNQWLFWASIAGYILACCKRPIFLMFFPLLVMALLSMKFGVRFTMYGGVPLGIGLGFGFNQLLIFLDVKKTGRWVIQLLAFAVLIISAGYNHYFDLLKYPNMAIKPIYAATASELRNKTKPNSLIWQWWDWGYAVQYFTERDTAGDGGRHAGDWLLPLAKAHMTSSMLQSAQIMEMTASTLMNQTKLMRANNTAIFTNVTVVPMFEGDPILPLRNMTAAGAQNYMDSLATTQYKWAQDSPENYIILSWENMRIMGWISFYGKWDLSSPTGNTSFDWLYELGQTKVNVTTGTILIQDQTGQIKEKQLSSLIVFKRNVRDAKSYTWPNNTDGIHAVYNDYNGATLLMGDNNYESMAAQLLFGNPAQFNKYFELVIDYAPFNRVYRVRKEAFK